MLVTYKGKRLEIHDALCMPNVKNLLSVDQLVIKNGLHHNL